jgi:hypothetical protein
MMVNNAKSTPAWTIMGEHETIWLAGRDAMDWEGPPRVQPHGLGSRWAIGRWGGWSGEIVHHLLNVRALN